MSRAALALPGGAGIGPRPCACAVRRRRAGGRSERLCRSATDARSVPCAAATSRQSDRDRGSAVHARADPAASGRRATSARMRRGSARSLSRDRRPDRRSDRDRPPRRDLHVRVRRPKAREHFEQCLAIARAISNHELEGECERLLGEIALDGGDLPTARARFARSLEVCRKAEDKRGEAMGLWWTGKADIAVGDREAGRTKLGEALRALLAFDMNAQVLGCLEDHAGLLHSIGNDEDAVRLCATVESFRERLVLKRPPRYAARWDHAIAALRAALGEAAFNAAWAEGRTWELEQATRFALASVTSVPWPPDGARIDTRRTAPAPMPRGGRRTEEIGVPLGGLDTSPREPAAAERAQEQRERAGLGNSVGIFLGLRELDGQTLRSEVESPVRSR